MQGRRQGSPKRCQGDAGTALVEMAEFQGVAGKIGVGQRVPPDAEEPDVPVRNISGACVDGVFLQPAITGANHGKVRKRPLQLSG